jgi:hypothetical protein
MVELTFIHMPPLSLDEVPENYRDLFTSDYSRTPLTRSLFLEFKGNSVDASEKGPYYTIKDQHYKNYYSAKRLYLDCEDPTEYLPGMLLLGSYSHFQYLTGLSFFRDIVSQWREELEVRLRSKGLRTIIKIAGNKDGMGFSAAKWLVDRGWLDTKGRPSKKKIEEEAKKLESLHSEVDEDINRMHEILSSSRH